MRQLNLPFLAILLLVAPLPALSQCPTPIATLYYGINMLRSSGSMITSTYAYASNGADAQYITPTVTQSDSLTKTNGVTTAIGNPFSGTGPQGGEAQTQRTTDINATGFGTYNTSVQVTSYRSCDGSSTPPAGNGDPGYIARSLAVPQPQVAVGSQMYVYAWAAYNNTGGSTPVYHNSLPASAYYPNAPLPGTPAWTVTGASGEATVSCTSCTTTTLTAIPTATVSCTPVIKISFVQDGLQSNTAAVAVLGAGASPYATPTHQADGQGYLSTYQFQAVDTCGLPLPYIFVKEYFDPYDTYTANNWNTPVGNSWNGNGSGVWFDMVGETDATIPVSLPPANPLGSTQIYGTHQTLKTRSSTGDEFIMARPYQIHLQDHGGYIY